MGFSNPTSIITDKFEVYKRAHEVLAKVGQDEIRSDRDAAKFSEVTNGVTHKILQEDWLAGGHRTVCIDFVCWYAAQMKIDILSSIPANQRKPKTDGFFDLENTLHKAGLGYAFVRPTDPMAVPHFGDILRHKKFHVDICGGFMAWTCMRYQGGNSSHPRNPMPSEAEILKEYDNVMYVHPKDKNGDDVDYDPDSLLGWLDIAKYFAGPPAAPESGKTGSLWMNRNNDLVHPDAPSGSGGQGFFRHAGYTGSDSSDLPHPDSAAARTLDPLELARRSRRDGTV